MDAFTAQFDRIRQQLAALTGSQRMLVGTLVAVMAATVLYWGKYAGTPDMVPVLEQQLTDEDIGPITRHLDLAGVPHSVVAGKVMVPADKKVEVLADLMYSGDLPHDTHWAFEEMTAKELNPFSSQTEREAVYNHATELELSGVIRRWPGVADARVVINNKNERHIGEVIPPTATVDISTRGGQCDAAHAKQLVQAAADGVAGAVSGLTQQNIRVIINGVSMRVPSSASAQGGALAGNEAIELQEHQEAVLEQKVRNQFAFIPGLTVTVSCEVDNRATVSHVQDYDRAKAFTEEVSSRTVTGEQHATDPATGEVGAASNTGTNGPASVDATGAAVASAAGVSSNTTSDEQNASIPYVSSTESTITTAAGHVTVKSAAVCVPMGYVARRLRQGGHEPTDAELQKAATAETARLRDQVARVVGLATTDTVSVDTFAEDTSGDLTMAASVGPATGTPAAALAGHAKEIAVGTLALVSLALMFQMARKSSVVIPTGGSVNPSLAGFGAGSMSGSYGGGGGGDEEDDGAANEEDRVGSTSTLLGGMEGMELDADQVRTQHMLDQVSTLVKEDPDAAAALVKRWVSRS